MSVEKLQNVSRETQVQLEHYVALLIEWNQAINLIASESDLWQRHITDSAQIAQFIDCDNSASLVDLGSGGGLPGIVLAILTGLPITLIESDRRKSLFLKNAAIELGLQKVVVKNERIEDVIFKSPIVTARALASLDKLLTLSESFLLPDSVCLFPKGLNYANEIEEAKKNWKFDCQTHPSISGNGVILEIRHLERMS